MPDPTPRGDTERPLPPWLAQPGVMAVWCVVDATGYLGYVAVMVAKNFAAFEGDHLAFFLRASWAGALVSLLALAGAWWFFARNEAVRMAVIAPTPANA